MQTFLRSSNIDFVENTNKAFLSDISLYKVNDKHVKNLFHDLGHSLPHETTCRKIVMQLRADELERIRNTVHGERIFLVVDESSLSGIQYLNILVGS